MASAPKSTGPLTGPIVFDGHATPVKSALFFIICGAWILPGLIGHGPWKSEDAVTFGVVLEMLTQGQWIAPHIAGVPFTEYPPLYAWLSALTAKLFSPLMPLHDAARLATGLAMAIAFVYVKKTAARLHDERAGRMAVLLLLGCLGLLLRGHEMNPEVLGLTGFTVALYGITRIRSESRKGGVTLGAGCMIIALSIGAVPAMVPLIIAVASMALLRDLDNRAQWRGWFLGLALPLLAVASWVASLMIDGHDLTLWRGAILGIPVGQTGQPGDWTYFAGILPWYALPALPFALWVWWKDRTRIRDRLDTALPLAAFVVTLIALSATRKTSDAAAMVLLLPLAIAASGAPDRLPRSIARFVDWVGLTFFGLGVLALWLYWTAAMTGAPAAAARAVARQAPGYTFEFALVPFVLALLLTATWLYAVIRSHRNNRRAIVNWSAGLTIVWVLPNLLALGAFDHVRGYHEVARSLATRVPKDAGCVAGIGVGEAQRALLAYRAGIRLAPGRPECTLILTQGTRTQPAPSPHAATLIWEGARPGDPVEKLRLYALSPDQKARDQADKSGNNPN